MFEIERPKIECKELNDYYGCFVVDRLSAVSAQLSAIACAEFF